MQAYTDLDIRENGIGNINRDLLNALLRDRTTKKNIIWATDDYIENGAGYEAGSEILDILITGARANIIRPRVVKAQMKKRDRTRTRAEVFTPSWVCNAQNNLIDAQWFGVENAFNEATEQGWKTNIEQISFPAKRTKSWKRYVDAKRLEITCGEAPYLASRYDSVTGDMIPLCERIGLLDRKFRVVNENATDPKEWKKWARRAIESIYGYEFHGDSLLLARTNILYTYIENYREQLKTEPSMKELQDIARVISWNLWQMDGFNYAIPYCETSDWPEQIILGDLMSDEDSFDFSRLTDTKGQQLYKIHDWRANKTIVFKSLVRGNLR